MLAPGTTLTACRGKVSLDCWFNMEYRPERHSDVEWAEEIAAAFSRSTRNAMAESSSVGLLLSGGLDSRMVVAAAERPIRCFHFNDWRNRECRSAERIAAKRGFPFRYIERPDAHYVRLFDAAVDVSDGLYGFVHAHPLGLIPTDEADVVMHGFAPELFFRGTNLPRIGRTGHEIVDPDLTADTVAAKIVTSLKYSLASRRPHQWFTPKLRDGFAGTVRRSADELLSEARQASTSPYDWFTWADTRYHVKYPSFLFERCLRPFHIERSVTLQNHVVDLHLRLPVEARSNSRIWNLAVRRLNSAVARVPDANTGQSPVLPRLANATLALPSRLARRVKKPHPPDPPWRSQRSWPNFSLQISHDPRLRNLIAGAIRNDEALDPDIFDRSRIDAALAEHVEGRANHQESLLLLATIGEWHRRYGPPGHNLP